MKLEDVIHTNVGGVRTACVDMHDLISVIEYYVASYRQGDVTEPLLVFDSNGHGISLANTDETFANALKSSQLIHADGQSVVSMSRWGRGGPIPERTATTDLIHRIPDSGREALSHFLLGGKQDIVERCGDLLTQQHPNFKLLGTQHGYFDKAKPDDVITKINDSNADVLWVGLGKPLEQEWIVKYRTKLLVPVIISCGGCYNYVTGDYKRAPDWMQKAGIEWLHRAFTQPKALLWRYISTNPHAIYCVLKHRFFIKSE